MAPFIQIKFGSGKSDPKPSKQKPAFTYFAFKVNDDVPWKKIEKIMSSIQDVHSCKMDSEGIVRVSGMIDARALRKRLAKAGMTRKDVSGWNYGKCSSQLVPPKPKPAEPAPAIVQGGNPLPSNYQGCGYGYGYGLPNYYNGGYPGYGYGYGYGYGGIYPNPFGYSRGQNGLFSSLYNQPYRALPNQPAAKSSTAANQSSTSRQAPQSSTSCQAPQSSTSHQAPPGLSQGSPTCCTIM